jgi:uncharacterized membrane protein
MDRMLVVVFDKESKAYEGKEALLALDDDGRISVYACVVISKNADGSTEVEQAVDSGPLGTLVGTSLGSFIGLLGGPAGLAIGAVAGLLAGGTADLDNARIGDDFVADVTKELRPNRFAVVAEVKEDKTAPVDTTMEALGGTVFRRALSEVRHISHDEDTAALRADLAQLKAEFSKVHADRKAKIQGKINQLEAKIQARIEKARERRKAAEAQAKAKAEVVKAKAAALETKADETYI